MITIDGGTGTILHNGTDYKSGSIIQVVESGDFSSQVEVTSNTFTDTGVTATITPSAATSKIMVMVNGASFIQGTSYNVYGEIRLLRASTEIARVDHMYDSSNSSFGARLGLSYAMSRLDTPSTTNATTYKVQIRLAGTNYSPKIRVPSLQGSSDNNDKKYLGNKIQLMEVAA